MLSMSLIETAPQKQKEYDPRKQDHGDAATKHQHIRDTFDQIRSRHKVEKDDARMLRSELNEVGTDYTSMTPSEREAVANDILGEAPLLAYSSEPLETTLEAHDDEPYGEDRFATEADFGIKSKYEIARAMARRVTLDVAYDEDDNGDDDYAVPVHIKNRL